MSDWYGLGRRILAEWQAAGQAAAEGARTAPLTRALDCVDAADELVAYMTACNASAHVASATNPANAANLQERMQAYLRTRGER